MSRLGKVFFLIAGFSVLSLTIVRTVLGGWHDLLFIPLVLFLVGFFAALIKERSFFIEILTMKTTKHGMNMGVLILLAAILGVAVNFLAVRHNKKWDLTEEGLNSLSSQSIAVLQKIKDDAEIKFFYRGGFEGIEQTKARFKEVVGLYSDENSKIGVQFIDSIKRPGLAKEYGVNQAAAQVFINYKGKRNAINPLSEEGITTALLKITRDKSKKVYFLVGHGEKDTASEGPLGASLFKKSLEDASYLTETLSLVDKTEIPQDADLVMVLGPRTNLLEGELTALRKYVRAGGHLFLAADPGEKHNLALLTKSFGVEFKNDFVLDQFGQMIGGSAAVSLGREYGTTPITKDFQSNMMTMFNLSSSLIRADDASPSLKVEKIVSTSNTSFTTDTISQGRVSVDPQRKGPHAVGMLVTGKDESIKTEAKEFAVVVYGDSDFLSNQLLSQQMNHDLASNSVSYLVEESDLISIRPKKAKGTTLTMTESQFWIYMFAVIFPIPLLLFGTGGMLWYRRRSA